MRKKHIETQVVVIGGGITGTALVRELTKYKVDVCLLEKEGACGFGITKGCQGAIHGGAAYMGSRILKYHGDGDIKDYLLEPLNLKERLQNMGRAEYFSLAPLLGLEVSRQGRISLAETKEHLELLSRIKELSDEEGIQGIELLDKKSLNNKEPMIHPKYIGGIFDPHEAMILPSAWAIAFAENAKQNGAHIFMETEVQEIEEKQDCFSIKTNNGTIKTEYVVNAAGLYADDIAKMVGACDFSVSGWKCQLLVMENKDYVHHLLSIPPRPQVANVMIPTTHNSVIIAHTMEPFRTKEDRSTTKEGVDWLLGWIREFIPAMSRQDLISSFASILTFNTKDPHDHLLESPKKRFINAVVAAPGLGPAPAIAREVVHMLAKQGLELIPRSDFNPFRQINPRFIELPEWEKKEKIQEQPLYGHIVCRCEKVSEQEIREAVRAGARTLDDIKFRTLAGFGRCQGGFCTSRILQIMADEQHISPLEITKKGGNSFILKRETKLIENKR